MIVDSKTMSDIDSRAISGGIPGETLMENAGRACVEEILKKYPRDSIELVTILVGPGNNGGDGFVIARLLIKEGLPVKVLILCQEKQIKGDSKINYDRLDSNSLHFIRNIEKIIQLTPKKENNLIIDAIFGTGLQREVTGLYAEAINYINSLPGPRIAIDIPSGISGDDGRILGTAVKADLSITFQLPKIGHYIHPGKTHRGKLLVKDIGIPAEVISQFHIKFKLLTQESMFNSIHKRNINTHKNTYGHALIISGSLGKAGAPVLVSKAAMKAGAGLVTLVVPDSIYTPVASQSLEVMVEPLETNNQFVSFNGFKTVFEKMKTPSVIAFGPGIGLTSETEKILHYLLECKIPLILDADAIRLLKTCKNKLSNRQSPTLLTPHPGEFAFLLGSTTEEVQKNRLNLALDFAVQNNVYLLLKGNDTIITDPNGHVSINSVGNPGMANAGQGDALTGFITGLLSSSYDPLSSLELATFLHGYAGDLLATQNGVIGILASEIIQLFPSVYSDFLPVEEE